MIRNPTNRDLQFDLFIGPDYEIIKNEIEKNLEINNNDNI